MPCAAAQRSLRLNAPTAKANRETDSVEPFKAFAKNAFGSGASRLVLRSLHSSQQRRRRLRLAAEWKSWGRRKSSFHSCDSSKTSASQRLPQRLHLLTAGCQRPSKSLRLQRAQTRRNSAPGGGRSGEPPLKPTTVCPWRASRSESSSVVSRPPPTAWRAASR